LRSNLEKEISSGYYSDTKDEQEPEAQALKKSIATAALGHSSLPQSTH
jgi:hypothetical protein